MGIFTRLKIRAKLLIVVGISAFALVAALGAAGLFLHERMFSDRVEKLKSIVDVAISMAQGLEAQTKAGKITHEEALVRFHDELSTMWYGNGAGYLTSTTMDGKSFANPNKPEMEGTVSNTVDPNGKPISRSMLEMARDHGEGLVDYVTNKPGSKELQKKITFVKMFAPWGLFVTSGLYVDDLDADFRNVLERVGAIGLGLLLLSAVPAYLIGRNISRSLASLKTKMEKVAAGDLSVAITEAARGDEIGGMAEALQVFKTNMSETERLRAEQKVAEEKATAEKKKAEEEAQRERKTVLNTFANEFEASIAGVVTAVSSASGQLQTNAQSMLTTAKAMTSQAGTVMAASDEASANVQTVATAGEELSSSIGEIGRQVTESSRVTREAVAQANRTNAQIQSLAEAAQRIGDWSNSSTTSPARPTFWRSTPPSRRPALAKPARALRSSRPRSNRSPIRRRRRPRRSAPRSTRCRRRPATRSPPSGPSPKPSAASTKSPPPSRRRSKSRAPPPRRSPATFSRPPAAPRKSPPTSAASTRPRPIPAPRRPR